MEQGRLLEKWDRGSWSEFSALSEVTQEELVFDVASRLVGTVGDEYCDPLSEQRGGNCVYTDAETGYPSCIVAHILDHFGYDISTLKSAIGMIPVDGLGQRAHFALAAMQAGQDHGCTWAVSVRIARSISRSTRSISRSNCCGSWGRLRGPQR